MVTWSYGHIIALSLSLSFRGCPKSQVTSISVKVFAKALINDVGFPPILLSYDGQPLTAYTPSGQVRVSW